MYLFYSQKIIIPASKVSIVISALQLKKIIDCGFQPLLCVCTQIPGGSLTIRVTDPSSGSVELLVAGVSTAHHTSSRAVAVLIAEL
ncbi:DUF1652 domain-containing protein [Pseudomonas koreensis]|uniref:DUF1652 domain-containing protein n=1 Tax=Pseudomonas koreensis TaxID=198620 RepID=UPI0038308241